MATGANGHDQQTNIPTIKNFLSSIGRAVPGHYLLCAAEPDNWDATSQSHQFKLPNNADTAAVWADALNQKGSNIYWTPNEVVPGLTKKARKKDIICARWVWADADPDPTITKQDYARGRKELFDRQLSAMQDTATLVVDSGNGLQAFWALNEHIAFNDESDRTFFENNCSKTVEAGFGARGTHNVDRVMRVAGTWNYPGKTKISKGYPTEPGLSEVLSVDVERHYPPEDVVDFAMARSARTVAAIAAPIVPVGYVPLDSAAAQEAEDKAHRAADVDNHLRALLNDEVVIGPDPYPSRSEARFALVRLLASSGLTVDEVAHVCLVCAFGQEEINRNKWPRALKAELGKAFAEVEAKPNEFYQRAKGLGEGGGTPDIAPRYSLDEMRERLIYIGKGQQVVDENRNIVWDKDEFFTYTAASFTVLPSPLGTPPKYVATAKAWITDPLRRTREVVTFHAGQGKFIEDPDGLDGYNLWRPIEHECPDNWEQLAQVTLEHIEYLVPIELERKKFIEWLAAIEQRPGELPHWHFLMIATEQGIGRSWLGALLAYVWRRYTALGFNLTAAIRTGFNGNLSRKILAITNEIHEGGTGIEQHKFAEALKDWLTEEHRKINPKYGKERIEFNSCRFLAFSNHVSAIRLPRGDRRLMVVENPRKPQQESYYKKIYGMTKPHNTHVMAAAFREYLQRVDLKDYNPGALPVVNVIKARVMDASESDEERIVREVLRTWKLNSIPAKVFTAAWAQDNPDDMNLQSTIKRISYACQRAGLIRREERIRFRGKSGASEQHHIWLRAGYPLDPIPIIEVEYKRWLEASNN